MLYEYYRKCYITVLIKMLYLHFLRFGIGNGVVLL